MSISSPSRSKSAWITMRGHTRSGYNSLATRVPTSSIGSGSCSTIPTGPVPALMHSARMLDAPEDPRPCGMTRIFPVVMAPARE